MSTVDITTGRYLKMSPLVYLIIMSSITFNPSEASECRDRGNADDIKLHDHLFTDYDVFSIPTNASCVKVFMGVALSRWKIEQDDSVKLYALLFLNWEDERLKWDPENYSGLEETHASRFLLWTPSLVLYGELDEGLERQWFVSCRITHDATVSCTYKLNKYMNCEMDTSNWPYDRQNCSITIGFTGKMKDIIKSHIHAGRTENMSPNRSADWRFIDWKSSETRNNTDNNITITYYLQRDDSSAEAMILYPSMILFILIFSSLFLDPREWLRPYLLIFCLFCHFNLLLTVNEIMPEGHRTPTILLYFRGSLIMNLFIIICSYILNFLCNRDVALYSWMEIINEYVFGEKFRRFTDIVVRPRWECKLRSDMRKKWIDFANFVNSILILVTVIVYMILHLVFVPVPPADLELNDDKSKYYMRVAGLEDWD